MYLCWGLRWGLLRRVVAGSGKVVSGAPPAVAVGSSSMTITGTLALFAALWARVLKRNKFRVKQMRYKTRQQGLKNYKYNKRILLFSFFLVGAERGEVEVRRAPGARRRRRSFPWPLGGSSGGGLRRPRSGCRRGVRSGRSRSGGPGGPRSSCRRSVRRSRGNSACRGGACHAARRLLPRLPLRYVTDLAETPSWWGWRLCLRRAV